MDLTGQRFGLLTVREFAGYTDGRVKRRTWLCGCDCGETRATTQSHLKNGQVTSCGCGTGNPESNYIKHKREYGVWASMKQRCLNPDSDNYHKYGGRGITVCERWLDFRNFLADMGPRPDGMTIDRIENNGNYEPGNCRWATPTEQAFNTRRNRSITYNGITRSLTQWAELYGIKFGTLWQRLEKGWPMDIALTRAPQPGKSEVAGRRRGFTAGGEP